MKLRSNIISKLQILFIKDYKNAMQQYSIEEQIEFTKYLLKLFDIYYKEAEETETNIHWIQQESERLKKKYGKNFKPYRNAQLYSYFQFDILLVEKGIFTTEEFNNFKNAEEQQLNQTERKSFMAGCCRRLQHALDELYLESPPESTTLKGVNKDESKTENGNNKAKIKRNANDKLTSLTQEQTALLLHYLQQERVFLKDEYLDKKDAGTAFEMLTGYSHNTVRQKLSSVKEYQNKANLKEIHNLVIRLEILLSKALREK